MGLSARRAATRDRLIDAALTVFAAKGVLAATVEEICEAAGFTRGAFYSNFTSKDDLWLAALDHQNEVALAATREALAAVARHANRSPAGLIRRAIDVFLASQRPDRRWVLASQELRLYAARTPAVAPVYREREERAASIVAEALVEATGALGLELATRAPQAIGVLRAVHDYSAVSELIGTDAPGEAPQRELLAEVLSALVSRPEG